MKQVPGECGLETLYMTSEGFYIFFPRSGEESLSVNRTFAISKKKMRDGDLTTERDVVDLLLGELDFKLHTIKRELLSLSCTMFKNAIDLVAINERVSFNRGKYFKLNVVGRKDPQIFFIEHSRVYIPVCEKVSRVVVRTEIVSSVNKTSCSSEVRVDFQNHDLNETGYLRDGMIIVEFPRYNVIECAQPFTVYVNASTILIGNPNGLISVLNEELGSSVSPYLAFEANDDKMYDHHDQVRAGNDLLAKMTRMIETAAHDSSFVSGSDQLESISGSLIQTPTEGLGLVTMVETYFGNIELSIKRILIWTGSITLVSLLIFVVLYGSLKYIQYRKTTRIL